jgi:hypothetical protein
MFYFFSGFSVSLLSFVINVNFSGIYNLAGKVMHLNSIKHSIEFKLIGSNPMLSLFGWLKLIYKRVAQATAEE